MRIPGLMFQGTYLHYKEIKAAQGIKITAQVKWTSIFFIKYTYV